MANDRTYDGSSFVWEHLLTLEFLWIGFIERKKDEQTLDEAAGLRTSSGVEGIYYLVYSNGESRVEATEENRPFTREVEKPEIVKS